jgi:hypothetical protein
VVEKFLDDFGESGEEAYREVGCRDIRDIEKLGDVFDANRR